MRNDHSEKDEIDVLLRETLTDDMSPELENRMQATLSEFNNRIASRSGWSPAGFRQAALRRWKLVAVCISIGFVFVSTAIDSNRQARIDALTIGNLTPQMVQSLQGGIDPAAKARHLERLLAQVPFDEANGSKRGDGSL